DLGRRNLERAAGEAAPPELGRDLVCELELLEDRRVGLAPLRLLVREARARGDHRAVEARLAARRDLDGHRKPVLERPQRAEVVRELVRQHRRDEARDVRRERPLGRAVVERAARRDEVRNVRDVHPGADPVGLAPERERVVEILRGLGIDRERGQPAQVDATVERGRRGVVRLEVDARAALDEQPLEDVLDPRRRAEHALDLRAAAPGADDRELARAEVVPPLRVEDEGNPGREVRLAHDEPAASTDLDDETVYTRRKRRSVRPEPSAPRASPIAIRTTAFSSNGIACTPGSFESALWRIAGSATSLPRTRKTIANTAPASPQSRPSTMNGPRTNQFVAPTSFITSISRR